MKTLLVTGGAGFIGSNFVHYWLATHSDDRVVVLDALTYAGNLANLAPVRDNPRFHFCPGQIQDQTVVDGLFRAESISHVVNFAAESHNDRGMIDPAGLILTNAYGVAILLEAVRKYGIERFLHVSTDEVYGEIDDGSFNETHPLEPRTPYSAAKAGGDLQVRAHNIAFATPAVITRGSNTFGPYQYPEKMLPFFITRALHDKRLPVYGDGLQVRDWIFVRDHCRGIAAALELGQSGEIYNVGGTNERTNLEVVRKVLAHIEKPVSLIKHIDDPRGKAHDRRYALDSSKLHGLGWAPERSFDDALRETVDWYVQNEDWWGPIVESSGYRSFISGYYGPYLGEDL